MYRLWGNSHLENTNKEVLAEAVKRIGLLLSDTISTKLNVMFTFKYFGKKLIPYEAIQKLEKKYYTFSLIQDNESPILNVLDTQIIYIFTNRILGGEGVVEPRAFKELFSFSEKYYGKYLINWIIDVFQNMGMRVTLDKIADSPKYYHIFLPDENVWQFAFEVFLGSKLVGMYFLCFDRNFLFRKEEIPMEISSEKKVS